MMTRPGFAILCAVALWCGEPVLAQETPGVAERALFQAAAEGLEELANFALERGADLEARDPRGNTPLLVAAQAGHPAVVDLLLAGGANPAAARDDGWNALHAVADGGSAAIARRLIGAGTPADAREAVYGNTPLLIATRRGNRGVAVALLDAGVAIDLRDLKDGNTPLINAAFDPLALGVLAELLARGAAVDAQAQKDGLSALMAAARNGNHGAVELLLAEGASPDMTDSEGRSALHFAAESGGPKVLRLLLAAGADPDVDSARGDTALGAAAAAGQLGAVRILLEAGADPNGIGEKGPAPLHRATMSSHAEIVRALLSGGAKPDLTDWKTGNTALMLAANRGFLDVVHLLLAHGARIDIVAKDGWTALQAAEMIGDEEIAALLRAAGARR
jgi:cytohesin